MFLKLLLISIVFLGIAFFGFAVKIIFSKKSEFPETRIGHNKELRKRKIYCVKTEQKIIDKNIKKQNNQGPACSSCM